MAYWLTVFCRESLSDLDAAAVLAGLQGRDPTAPAGDDYFTLAEGFDVDDAAVEPALAALAVAPDPSGWALRYREDPTARPVVVHVWRDPARIAQEVTEARDVRNPPPLAARLLDTVACVVALELGWSMLEDMGIVLAYEAARFLAQRGDGVVVDDESRWSLVIDGAWRPLVDDDRAGSN